MRLMLNHVLPMADDSVRVHAHCEIHPSVRLGARTVVWQFASVIRSSVLGEDCSIGACAVVDAAMVGDRCRIGAGAQLHPGTRLEDDIFVGPGAIFCNDRWPRVKDSNFSIESFLSGDMIASVVRDGASIGAGAIVMPDVVIGRRAMIAAGAMVVEDIPADHLLKRSGAIVKIDAVERVEEARKTL